MPTNIVIDDGIMQTAMEVSGISTQKDVVEQAMREFVERRTRKNLADLRGKIRFADDYGTPARKPLEGLFGILGKDAFEADGVTLQRQWRDEWPS